MSESVRKICWACRGTGETEYCVNPDNGHLDTQMNNLRYEKGKCYACNGTGRHTPDAVSSPRETANE